MERLRSFLMMTQSFPTEIMINNIFVNKLKSFFQEDIRVDSFFDGESLFEKSRPYDVVFFDVELGENKEDGLSLCKKYKTVYPEQKHIAIILTTHTELGRYGYMLNAFRYIDKLNLDEELEEAVHAVELIWGNEKSIQFNFDKIGVEDVIDDYLLLKGIKTKYYISRRKQREFVDVFIKWRMDRALG